MGDHHIVAGGLIGKPGDIVVDSVSSPTLVFGIARGDGQIEHPPDEDQLQTIERIKELLDAESSWWHPMGGNG